MLLDPGNFSHGFEGITGLDAILITHQHPDHVDLERLPALLQANPSAQLYADPMTASQLGERWTTTNAGDVFTVGGIQVTGVGGTHAVIHPELPTIDNTGYLLGTPENPAQLFHPGDSLFVPEQKVDVLAIPAAAPWSKISETVDFLRAVAPRAASPAARSAKTSACGSPAFGWYPSPTVTPSSSTMTQPTTGFGKVLPVAVAASSSARRMRSASTDVYSAG